MNDHRATDSISGPVPEAIIPSRPAGIKTGLRAKFILAVSFLVLALSATFGFGLYHLLQRAIWQEFKETHRALAGFLGEDLAACAGQGDSTQQLLCLERALRLKKVAYVQWLGPEGDRKLGKARSDTMPVPSLSVEDKRAIQAGRVYFKRMVGKAGIHDFIVPLQAAGEEKGEQSAGQAAATEPKGFLRLGIDAGEEQGALRRLFWISSWLLFFFVVCGVGLACFLSSAVIKPIQQLAQAMKCVASEVAEVDETGMPKGRRFRRIHDVELNIRSQDEIGQLAEEFQMMLRKLEQSYQCLENILHDKNQILQEKSLLAENLREANRKNEMIIKERTREVVEKNLRLYEIFEELQMQKEELIGMNVQLEKISRMKSEFLASMSHELRTPMNSIIGFAEVLKEKMFGDLNERQEKYLSNILASARHLLQLINNILDISKVEAGKMKLVIEPYSLNRVVDEVQSTIRTLAYKKNIEMEMMLGRDVVMQGDISKVKQILYNLLSNAIKFT
ncbi:MAG: HAMP domain-containing protein, partial [Deltaproteobacteria bacterium]|nr:HAMP domain-containing protein [Deltaproteobacteria bacterium]